MQTQTAKVPWIWAVPYSHIDHIDDTSSIQSQDDNVHLVLKFVSLVDCPTPEPVMVTSGAAWFIVIS